MAKIQEEKLVIMLSRLVKSEDIGPDNGIITEDQLETLQQLVEGLIDDEKIVVEIVS